MYVITNYVVIKTGTKVSVSAHIFIKKPKYEKNSIIWKDIWDKNYALHTLDVSQT